MSQKNKDILKIAEEKKMTKKEKEKEEFFDKDKETDYQKAVNLMQSIRCMYPSKDKADRYLDAAKRFEQLADYKDSKELAAKCGHLALETEEKTKDYIYKNAQKLQKQAKGTDDYMFAAEEFRKISGYLDADILAQKCEESVSLIEKNAGKKRLLRNVAVVLAILAIVFGIKSSHGKYYLANVCQSAGAYNQAIKVYKRTKNFKDSSDRIYQCEYQNGVKAMAAKDYKNAKIAFEAAEHYKDSDEKKVEAQKLYIKNSEAGDTINIDGKRWRILNIQDNQALLLKDPALPAMAYNAKGGDVTWEQSTLRNWLNSEYLENNFTKAERDNIILTSVKNSDNLLYGTDGGEDTKDYIYLLSVEEITLYNDLIPDLKSNSWLRSPGSQQSSASFLSVNGLAMAYGYEAVSEDFRIMPVMWFNLLS